MSKSPSALFLAAVGCLSCVLLAVSPARAQSPAASPAPSPTLEQRVAQLEAYMTNSDPSAPLKDSAGNLPAGIKTALVDNSGTSPAFSSGPGHNAWMMVSAALVLFMTLPGLALFYGGLVRRKNVLSVCAQCFGCAGLVTLLWWAVGYSLVFGTSFSTNHPFLGKFFGGSEFFFLNGVDSNVNPNLCFWASQNVVAMYQLMFAIITPALIVGAIAERMKFTALMWFIALWMFLVYFPLAHMVWGPTGFMNGTVNKDAGITALDFAGGTVVHMSSGWSALILCLILGKRMGFGKTPMPPHSMVLCMVGTGMLWVGWYGFNAGSALAADVVAANAFMTTTLATATAAFTWPTLEYFLRGKPSILGYCSGAVAGLVVVTPACGYVNATGAIVIGVGAALVPFFFVVKVKAWFGYDDALDTFGVHAVGGTLGAFLTGILATGAVNSNVAPSPAGTLASALNPATVNGMAEKSVHHLLWIDQLKAIALTLVLAAAATTLLAYGLKAVMGLRPSEDVEQAGLDVSEHGEEGYHDPADDGLGHVTLAMTTGHPAGSAVMADPLAR